MSIPVPLMVKRVKSTCFESAASTGNVVRVTHTSTVESLSATEAAVGIEKEAANRVRGMLHCIMFQDRRTVDYHHYPQGL